MVVGGVDVSTKEAFMVTVSDRTKATLKEVINMWIEKRAIIHTDDWKVYEGVREGDYEYKTASHK